MLGGYEVVEVAALETLAATNVPVFFGDLNKAYHIADNLRHRFIITDQVTKPGWTKVFVSTMSGGGIVDSNAIKLLKMAAA
jgi:HK97 family phage major capsid protein